MYITNQYISQSIFSIVSEGHGRTTSGAELHQGVEDERGHSTVPGAAQEEEAMIMHAPALSCSPSSPMCATFDPS